MRWPPWFERRASRSRRESDDDITKTFWGRIEPRGERNGGPAGRQPLPCRAGRESPRAPVRRQDPGGAQIALWAATLVVLGLAGWALSRPGVSAAERPARAADVREIVPARPAPLHLPSGSLLPDLRLRLDPPPPIVLIAAALPETRPSEAAPATPSPAAAHRTVARETPSKNTPIAKAPVQRRKVARKTLDDNPYAGPSVEDNPY